MGTTGTSHSRDRRAEPSVGTADLYWIPLGAGTHVVRISGRAYERLAAWSGRRRPCALFHSALVVTVPDGVFTIEQAPVPDLDGADRGVVAEGPVGMPWAGRFRLFRYEIRCWRDGSIPDLDEAASDPVRVTDEPERAARIIELVATIPTPTWGRDELHTGEMWNSNSVIAWVLARSGVDTTLVRPPDGGRAPGWGAGAAVAGSDPPTAVRAEQEGAPNPGGDPVTSAPGRHGAASGAFSRAARWRWWPAPR